MNETTEQIRKIREELYDRIEADIRGTGLTYARLAKKHGVSPGTVYQVARCRSCRRTYGPPPGGGRTA